MKLKSLTLLITASLLGFTHSSQAADLMEIYSQALTQDPIYKGAHGTYFSNKEIEPQARAALLPNVGLTNSATRNNNNNSYDSNGNSAYQTFNENVFNLTASQPVFNYQAWKALQQAKDSVKSQEATYNAAAQNLIIRVATAYINVLQARDNLTFAGAQKRALKRQMEQADQRYKVGLDTMTSVYQAQANYDAIVAQEMAYKNQLFINFEQLRTLTNKSYDKVAPLNKNKLPLIAPKPADPQVWVDKALTQNYTLLSAKYAMDAARENIKVQEGGHYPIVSVGGSYGNTQDNVSGTSSNTGSNKAISLNLTLPLYQGGLVVSQTRQAEYAYETTAATYQSNYLNTLVSAKTAYNTLLVTMSQIKADKNTVLSSEKSVESTEAQFQVGTMTMVDVLTAQQQLYQSQTQQATDQYAYLNAILNLKLAAGTLSVTDLAEINSWLDKRPANAVINNEKIT